LVEESQDAPAPLARHRLELGRRIGGHRVGGLLEQGQVVGRIAVDADALEIVPAQAAFRQPLSDTRDLAFAQGRRALDPAGRPRVPPSQRFRQSSSGIGRLAGNTTARRPQAQAAPPAPPPTAL